MATRKYEHPELYQRIRKTFKGKSKTRAIDAGETDVNKIVARHAKTGVVSHLNHKPAQYGDLSQATDLHAAINMTLEAQEGFKALPATVRRAADNDPRIMLEMLADPAGTQQLVDAGLELVLAPEERDPAPTKLPFEHPSGGESAAPAEGVSPQSAPAEGAPSGGEQTST